jgi:hypothetical protein
MQGQMHVHVTEMDLPVPLLGQFFRHLLAFSLPSLPCFLVHPGADHWLDSVSVTGRVLLGVI